MLGVVDGSQEQCHAVPGLGRLLALSLKEGCSSHSHSFPVPLPPIFCYVLSFQALSLALRGWWEESRIPSVLIQPPSCTCTYMLSVPVAYLTPPCPLLWDWAQLIILSCVLSCSLLVPSAVSFHQCPEGSNAFILLSQEKVSVPQWWEERCIPWNPLPLPELYHNGYLVPFFVSAQMGLMGQESGPLRMHTIPPAHMWL